MNVDNLLSYRKSIVEAAYCYRREQDAKCEDDAQEAHFWNVNYWRAIVAAYAQADADKTIIDVAKDVMEYLEGEE